MRYFVSLLLSALLSACGGGSGGTASPPSSGVPPVGGTPDPQPTPSALSVSRSGSETISVKTNGGSQTITITFTSGDDRAVDVLAVTEGLSDLPAGWSGPTSFECLDVASGSSCVLSLTYAPSEPGQGTLSLEYQFGPNDEAKLAGTLEIPFASTADNNVLATANLTGQIVAVVGEASQSVLIGFRTDDGSDASDLTVTTNLSSLPAGWSSASSAFACNKIDGGNGCQLHFAFAPTVFVRGTLSLGYSYTNNAGEKKQGSLDIPYSALTHNAVVATTSPTLPISTVIGGKRTIAVTFTTNDGHPASDLQVTSNLSSLPAGWAASASAFSCVTVSIGNGCQLQLDHEPSAYANGSFTLEYSFVSNAGRAGAGQLLIDYSVLTENTVTATPSVLGQIVTMTNASQVVTLTFQTDDGHPATDLAIDSNLSALPAGWSAASSLECALVSTGAGCALTLTHAPTVVGSGTLVLNYSYTNNAGQPKTGSSSLNYAVSADNNVIATSSVNPMRAQVDGAQHTSIRFAPDDGNPVTNVTVTNLSSLPATFTKPASVSCASVTAISSCTFSLFYRPLLIEAGTLQINFSYTNHAGIARTGSLSVPYASYDVDLYYTGPAIDICRREVGPGGTPTGSCSAVGAYGQSGGFAIGGDKIYQTGATMGLAACDRDETTGGIGACTWRASAAGHAAAVLHSHLYVATNSGVAMWPLDTDGEPTAAQTAPDILAATVYNDVEAYRGALYVANDATGVWTCPADATGEVATCTEALDTVDAPKDVEFAGDWAYLLNGDGSVDSCVVDEVGTFSDCSKADMTFIGTPRAIAMTDEIPNLIFIAADSQIYRCSVTDGRVVRSCWGTVSLPAGGTRLTFGVRGF